MTTSKRGPSPRIKYNPVPSVSGFLRSESFISLIVGPVGSTKTTAGIMKIAYHAKRMAPCADGIRRSRAVWIRNTNQMLKDTSIPDFLKWFPDGIAGIYMKTDYKFILKFDDVECEVMFRGLEDANDVRRLLSLQLSFGIMDEFREINKDIFEALQTRLGRYPDKSMVEPREEWGVDDEGNPRGGCVTDTGEENKHLWGMTNPPDMDTFWEDFISNPPKNAEVFIQPSGLSPEADWVKYLPPDYYKNMSEGKSEDWIDVNVHAKFGRSLSGKPVFRSFNKATHVSETALTPVANSTRPVIVGFDCTGLGPAAVIGQLGFNGRLYIYDSIYAEEMGALRFIREVLKPLLTAKYGGCHVVVVIDPAGMQRGNDERNVRDLLVAERLAVIPARTNAITARIAAVELYLTRTIDGKSGVLIDPVGASLLVTALQSKYRFKIKRDGDVEDKPDKIRPWADIADSMQYLCLHADNGSIFGANVSGQRREIRSADRKIV